MYYFSCSKHIFANEAANHQRGTGHAPNWHQTQFFMEKLRFLRLRGTSGHGPSTGSEGALHLWEAEGVCSHPHYVGTCLTDQLEHHLPVNYRANIWF